MKALVVYVNSQINENFEHGLARGVWGFKPQKARPPSFGPGDWIVFGRAYTGGGPRTTADKWFRHALEEIVVAQITTGLPLAAETPGAPLLN